MDYKIMVIETVKERTGTLVNYINSYLDNDNKIIINSQKRIENIKVIIKDINDNNIYVVDGITFNINDYNWFTPINQLYYMAGFKIELFDKQNNLLYKTVFELVKEKKDDYLFNRVSKINDLYDDIEELGYLKNIGYCDNYYDVLGYCYIHKWSRMLKIIKNFDLLKKDIKFVEIGGGLSPIQFILANNKCKIYNLDINFDSSWFPTIGKYYVNATKKFIKESNKNISNITFIKGDIYETVKNIENNSINCVIDTCSLHTLIGSNLYVDKNKIQTPQKLINEISRVLKSGGYFISVGDIANPHLGQSVDLFKYPKDMANILNQNESLKLLEPYDYDTWDDELKNYNIFSDKKSVNLKDLSLINMKYHPDRLPLKGTYGKVYLWVSTYILKKI
jgi:SAM-dependent methyltransferase